LDRTSSSRAAKRPADGTVLAASPSAKAMGATTTDDEVG
jgi:hypothetical protein